MTTASITKIQVRRGTAAQWGSTTLLSAGEIGFETDTGRFKIGNGVAAWAQLPYATEQTASYALVAGTAGTASFARHAGTASYATTSLTSSSAVYAAGAGSVSASNISGDTLPSTLVDSYLVSFGGSAVLNSPTISSANISAATISLSTINSGFVNGTTLSSATINNSTIADSNISGGTISNVVLSNAGLEISTLSGASIIDSDITGGTINASEILIDGIPLFSTTSYLITQTPLSGGGFLNGTLTLSVGTATVNDYGITRLINSTSSTSTIDAATPSSVKSAYDLANNALSKNGPIIFGSTQTFSTTGFTGGTTEIYLSPEATTTVLKVDVDDIVYIKGITPTSSLVDGRILIIQNISYNEIILMDEFANNSYDFLLPYWDNLIIWPNQAVVVFYDLDLSQWIAASGSPLDLSYSYGSPEIDLSNAYGYVNLTYGTALPISTGVSGLGNGVATFLGTASAANLSSAILTKTGTAGALVFSGTSTVGNGPDLYNANLVANTNTINVTATAFGAGTTNVDILSGNTYYSTGNATANGTVNFRANSSTTLSSLMAIGENINVKFILTNGVTPYRPAQWQVDGGTTQITGGTPKWFNYSATGVASAIDEYSITIIKTGASSFTLLAGLQSYK